MCRLIGLNGFQSVKVTKGYTINQYSMKLINQPKMGKDFFLNYQNGQTYPN